MEKTKEYRVLVEQVDRFSFEFTVAAASKGDAKNIVKQMIETEPLDCRKNTYVGAEVSVEVIDSQIQVHTVEALFDIDKDISDEKVILLDDLSEKQKTFLGLASGQPPIRQPLETFLVLSSGGSLKVDAQNGVVIECSTHRNEDNELKQIARFDLKEYKEHYKVAEIPGNVDILDLGYWNKDGRYERPVDDWRSEMRRVE